MNVKFLSIALTAIGAILLTVNAKNLEDKCEWQLQQARQEAKSATATLYELQNEFYVKRPDISQNNVLTKFDNGAAAKLDPPIGVAQVYNAAASTLGYLLHKPHFCLLNRAYDEVLYMAVPAVDIDTAPAKHLNTTADKRRRYGFTWNKYDRNSAAPLIKRFIKFTPTEIKLTLQSKKFGLDYYLNRGVNALAGRYDAELESSVFDVMYNDNALGFKQNNTLLCADDKFDQDRRFVRGFELNQRSLLDKTCQWEAAECPPPE